MHTTSVPSSTAAAATAVERSRVSVEAARRAVTGVAQQMIPVMTYSCCAAETADLHARTHKCAGGREGIPPKAAIELSGMAAERRSRLQESMGKRRRDPQ